jgi:Mn2+/Fe2+ NRAMP family transporter
MTYKLCMVIYKLDIMTYKLGMVTYKLGMVTYAKHFEDIVDADADWVNRTLHCIYCS